MTAEERQATIEAIAKYEHTYALNHNGTDLWTDGHLCLAAKVSAETKQVDSIGTLWDRIQARQDSPLVRSEAITKDFCGRFYRSLNGEHGTFVVDEAYWRLVRNLGTPYATTEKEPVAIRSNGRLTAMLMCMRSGGDCGEKTDIIPSDPELFARFACQENGWHLQGAKILGDELAKTSEQIACKKSQIADLESEVTGLEGLAADLRRRIKEAGAAV